VNKFLPLVFALCFYATFCSPNDTNQSRSWGRTVEPMLSKTQDWQPCRKISGAVVSGVQCGTEPLLKRMRCDFEQPEALRYLALYEDCIDRVIVLLEPLAKTDAASRSDLAAAWYVKAQREDRGTALLQGLTEAASAAAHTPKLPAASFNHALLLEAAGLHEQAIDAWNEFLRIDRSAWAREAREHRDRLRRGAQLDSAVQWKKNRLALAGLLRDGNRNAVALLVAPAVSAAQVYLEEELLPRPEFAAEARLLASIVAEQTKDPYVTDVVAALEAPGNPDAVREGHRRLKQARELQRSGQNEHAVTAYNAAAKSLAAGGSPLHFTATIDAAKTLASMSDGADDALRVLEPVERKLESHAYRRIAVHAQAVRAYALTWLDPPKALITYDNVVAAYEKLGDREAIAGTRARRAGVRGLAGDKESALRDAFAAMRDLSHIVSPQARHAVLGEARDAAFLAGYAATALAYQNEAIAVLTDDLIATSPENVPLLRQLLKNLSIAFRARAELYAEIGAYPSAHDGIESSLRLIEVDEKANDANNRRTLQAYTYETQGQIFLKQKRLHEAIAAFTKAIQRAPRNESLTFRANLFARRAQAKLHAGQNAVDVKHDLTEALETLGREEARILATRRRGEGEEIWNKYFSRFEETYHRLIRLHVDSGDVREAYRIAERVRAVELRSFVKPASDRLPSNTFLLEYQVLADRTYCWIVSEGVEVRFIQLPVGSATIEKWRATFATRDRATFASAAIAAYQSLLAQPLKTITGPLPRLVIVPDGPMHGLPFAALRESAGGRYLIEHAIVELAPSAAVYHSSLLRDRELASIQAPTVLAVGDPDFDRELVKGFPRLWYAQNEARKIAQLYGTSAQTLIYSDASVPRFIEAAKTKTVVHFAGHSIVNADLPGESVLLLAKSPGHSGALSASRLLTDLKLDRTKLVVLASCSSAGGRPVGPEGVAPLVRPLLAARVPAVIGSLWLIDDATASDIFVSFHRRYRKGEDAATALRAAQLEMILNRSDVFAWAPYQVIGHSSSPFGGTQK